MINNKLKTIDLQFIEPKGFIKDQLELQLEGFTLNLDEHWASVCEYSDWLGGSNISWERPPYWLDGLIPIAYLLKSDEGIKKARKWVEYILSSQRENGDFGPTYKTADFNESLFWPKYVMLKVFISFYEATEDERVIPFMEKYFKFCKENYETYKMKEWAQARGGDLTYTIFWLYDKTKNEELLELIEEVIKQTLDWSDFFTNLPITKPTAFYYDWKTIWEESTRGTIYNIMQFHFTHVVNVAMGIKQPALKYKFTNDVNDLNAVYKGIENLMKYHGQVYGMFSGDEHLAGINPTQGVELCAVVEYMFSLQNLFEITGDTYFMDILERVTYNALPATITEDFKGHQYVQQANQVLSTVDKRNWYNLEPDSNIFGLEPNFGCCTANMHQGWPKYLKNAFLVGENAIYTGAYMPIEVTTFVNGEKLIIEEVTNYPFDNKIDFIFKCNNEIDLNLYLRVPNWCKNYSVIFKDNDKVYEKKDGFVIFKDKVNDGHKLSIIFDMPLEIKDSNYNNGVSVERGPIVFSLNIDEERSILPNGVKSFPNYEMKPKTNWNYSISKNNEYKLLKTGYENKQIFSKKGTPIIVETQGKLVESWKLENNSAGDLPINPDVKNVNEEKIQLIPYGSAKLRVAVFPKYS